jgi:hypothetical protein
MTLMVLGSLFVVLIACAGSGRYSHAPRLTEEHVIAIANAAARDEHADLSKYRAPQAYFEYVKKDWSWAIFYDGIEPTIGNHFMVVVDDRTGDAEVVRGL